MHDLRGRSALLRGGERDFWRTRGAADLDMPRPYYAKGIIVVLARGAPCSRPPARGGAIPAVRPVNNLYPRRRTCSCLFYTPPSAQDRGVEATARCGFP